MIPTSAHPQSILRTVFDSVLATVADYDAPTRSLAVDALLGMLQHAPGHPEQIASSLTVAGPVFECHHLRCWCRGFMAEPGAVAPATKRLISMHSNDIALHVHHLHLCPEGSHDLCTRSGLLAFVVVFLATHSVPRERLEILATLFPHRSTETAPSGTLVN